MSRPTITAKITKDGTGNAIKLTDAMVTRLIGESTAAVEGQAKVQAQELIYDQPPAKSGYDRTGHLMNSITHELLSEQTGQVSAAADYAVYVHEGTEHTAARPFLWNALLWEQRRVASRARRIARQEGLA